MKPTDKDIELISDKIELPDDEKVADLLVAIDGVVAVERKLRAELEQLRHQMIDKINIGEKYYYADRTRLSEHYGNKIFDISTEAIVLDKMGVRVVVMTPSGVLEVYPEELSKDMKVKPFYDKQEGMVLKLYRYGDKCELG